MRTSKIKKKQKNKKEQNSESDSEEPAAQTDQDSTLAVDAMESKYWKKEAKKTTRNPKPRKTLKPPRNVKKEDVKDEGSDLPVKAGRLKRRGSTTPSGATKVKKERADAEPRRRSARLSCS